MTIYVGNLSHQASEEQLNELFSTYGEVKSAKIIMDHYTGQPKGFGFVEMQESSSSTQAIQELHEKDFMGRNLVVNEARPRNNTSSHRTGSAPQRDNGGYTRRF